MKRFAAPFVIVTACGHSPPTPEALARAEYGWTIEHEGDQCYAEESDGNPPAIYMVRCVYGDDDMVDVSLVDGACWADEPTRKVACPSDVVIDAPSEPEPKEHPPWLDDGPR